MEREEIRLECLKIRAERRPDLDAQTIVKEAKIFEDYILDALKVSSDPKKSKKPVNAEPLS